ncbi:MAG: hypothetical protein ABW199_13080 [Caulobacterales bacterium]
MADLINPSIATETPATLLAGLADAARAAVERDRLIDVAHPGPVARAFAATNVDRRHA